MSVALVISPHGRLVIEESDEQSDSPMADASVERLRKAFAAGSAAGLLHLGTAELQSELPPSFSFAREIARDYLTRLCHTPRPAEASPSQTAESGLAPIPAPPPEDLESRVLRAPPMKGLEYLTADVLAGWWSELDEHVRREIAAYPGLPQDWLREKNPLWRMVGRVTFHLAENKRDESYPFAFMATYASRLSSQGRAQHLPLGNALREYSGANNRDVLLSLLQPIHRATEKSALVKQWVDAGDIYQPMAWSPRDAYRFLKEIPALEESGIVVRVPDWWKAKHPPRPQVSVKVGDAARTKLGADALLDFSVSVTLDGERLTQQELEAILSASGGLVPLRGKWVEVDKEKLKEALTHWKKVEREASGGGISFFEGMRLLSGAAVGAGAAEVAPEAAREWTGIVPGEWLNQTLTELRDPSSLGTAAPKELRASLRPYQQTGVNWLRFMTRLGLGACLADDMGLGKTIQVIALLLHLKAGASPSRDRDRLDESPSKKGGATSNPSLLVAPASLLANWKSEIDRFAPSLSVITAHPSEMAMDDLEITCRKPVDLIMTTYGMLSRLSGLRERQWNMVILDEAQAIKNSGTRQARAVKELKAAGRITLTGTPVENRLSDLWSLFDFLNPGLLGGAKAFGTFAKNLTGSETASYGPLRTLVRPYILRRLKTDKKVISDLPDKTEVNAFCTLTKAQAVLYEQSVGELGDLLSKLDGIQRRGVVLAFLMRLKQICNHPSQWLASGNYDPADSGKFSRLREICQQLVERQEKVLVFTQFREITDPFAEFLGTIFGRPGLVLHGGTPVKERRELVQQFQSEQGPPFFVLSLKAGGTGLNLTAASHVIHFDRWWNPAVENQATDRAFRIGQKRNVLVHKFVCRGTVEEKIDQLIAEKTSLSRDVLEGGGGEKLLTEMDNHELLRLVALDIHRAVET
jgi:superfamily II DNA or RNA helicase